MSFCQRDPEFRRCFENGLLLVAHDVVVGELPPDRRRGVVVDEAGGGGFDARFLDRPAITRTLLIISPIPARCPFPEWMKTGKLAGSLAALRNGSMGAGSSVIGLIAKTRYFIPAASVAVRSASP